MLEAVTAAMRDQHKAQRHATLALLEAMLLSTPVPARSSHVWIGRSYCGVT